MILVSPGHYASSVGARHTESGFTEYPETRLWARELKAQLGDEGWYVGSQKLGSKVRAVNTLCRDYNVKLAVEIHFNSARNADGVHVGKGSETLYCPGSRKGKAYAEKVQEVLAKQFPPNRGVKEGWYQRRRTSGPLYFLNKTACPAIIIEPQFIQYHSQITSRRIKCCKALAQVLLEL